MKIEYVNGPIRSLLLPIFNVGQLAFVAALVGAIIFVYAAVDKTLALYLLVGSYFGIVISNMLLGLAPSQISIKQEDIPVIRDLLDSSSNLVRISQDEWSIRKYSRNIWKSDRVKIDVCGRRINLSARRRDLLIILQLADLARKRAPPDLL